MSGQFCIDANIFIEGWYTYYPPHIFKSLWDELIEHRESMVLIRPVYDELKRYDEKESEADKVAFMCSWLDANNFSFVGIDSDIENASLKLQKDYQTKEKGPGASKVDITLIAYAKNRKKSVVTFERKQSPDKSRKLYNYKIPLVCQLEDVACIQFVEMLERLQIEI